MPEARRLRLATARAGSRDQNRLLSRLRGVAAERRRRSPTCCARSDVPLLDPEGKRMNKIEEERTEEEPDDLMARLKASLARARARLTPERKEKP